MAAEISIMRQHIDDIQKMLHDSGDSGSSLGTASFAAAVEYDLQC